MSQQPGYGYGPPGGYPNQPQYGAPPQQPRRGGFPWGWVLGGCGGCFALVIIIIVVAGAVGFNFVKEVSQSVGPVTQQSVQQSMGDVPLYPNATLDTQTTQIMITSFRTGEKLAGKAPGTIFRGVAVLRTGDPPEKVLAYYDEGMKASGWQPVQTQNSNPMVQQRAYRKGSDFAMVQAQQQEGATMVTLMRGGSDLMKNAPTGGSTSPSGSG